MRLSGQVIEDTARMDVLLLFAERARANDWPGSFQVGRKACLNERVGIRGRVDGGYAIGQDCSQLFRRVWPVAGLFELINDTNDDFIANTLGVHF